jgi:hypothetical protein
MSQRLDKVLVYPHMAISMLLRSIIILECISGWETGYMAGNLTMLPSTPY